MARNNNRNPLPRRGAPKDVGRRIRKKPCAMCRDRVEWVDYKDIQVLKKYLSDRGKIRSRRVTGNCAQHQRAIAMAIKTARELVLLPYTQRTVTERPGGRGGREGDFDDGYSGRDARVEKYEYGQEYEGVLSGVASELSVSLEVSELDVAAEERS